MGSCKKMCGRKKSTLNITYMVAGKVGVEADMVGGDVKVSGQQEGPRQPTRIL